MHKTIPLPATGTAGFNAHGTGAGLRQESRWCFWGCGRLSLSLLLIVVVVVIAGCASQYTPPDYSSYVWPKPPRKPRLRLLNIIRTDLDVRQRSVGESLFGEEATFSFTKPQGIAVDGSGNIYVTDSYKRAVFVINPDQQSIGTLSVPGRMASPYGVAIDDQNGLLAVSDVDMVMLFDRNSRKLIRRIGGRGEFTRPSGLAFDPSRKVLYIADTRRSEIYSYDYSGRRLATIASPGSEPGKVYYPTSLATDKDGRLFVADTMNFRVQIFNPDGSFLRAFGEHGDRPGMFARPKGIAVSRDNQIFVTDADFGVFQMFNDEGRIYMFAGGLGERPAKFNVPADIAVDDKDRVYVVDQINRRVQIFQVYTDRYYKDHPEEAAKYKEESKPKPSPAAEAPKAAGKKELEEGSPIADRFEEGEGFEADEGDMEDESFGDFEEMEGEEEAPASVSSDTEEQEEPAEERPLDSGW